MEPDELPDRLLLGEVEPADTPETVDEYHGPPPPAVAPDPKTGDLPFGWQFADE